MARAVEPRRRSGRITPAHGLLLITGATGFVGGRLLSACRDAGPVRVLVRDASRVDADGIDVVEGDLGDEAVLAQALDGCACAYYLVHSMEAGVAGGYAARDRALATGFAEAATRARVERIVYLGGITPGGGRSEHLESRSEVEATLGRGSSDLVTLRASMIVGAQSDSFRTLAQLVERLPVLALPSWRDTCTQPVAIDDVVDALLAAADVPPGGYDIAGPDTLTIGSMIDTIAEQTGRKRPTIDLPFSSSPLESAAAALVTESSRDVLEPLLEGLHHDLVVHDNALEPVFGVTPTPFAEAARAALAELESARNGASAPTRSERSRR